MDTEKKDRFFIPKQIKVGYVERQSTYTGKLAYVIYIDHTGKVRKETSWNSWRDHGIEPNDFENVPTEGFVLNKHVGGYKSDWNFRQSYCRIYDPRGFEFEITIDNLLWILDWEDCYHGKGLSGKFVYGWMGDALTLIPCCTDDYKKSIDISNQMYEMKNMSKDDLVPRALYKIKVSTSYYCSDPDELVFIGNLKISQKLGQTYKSCLLFYDINNKENKDKLIIVDKKNIKAKLSDEAITEDELNDLLYRFSISAYSQDFWNTSNIIEKFIPKYGPAPKRFDWRDADLKLGVCRFIDDTHVTLFKQEHFYKQDPNSSNYYSCRYYKECERYYEFITFDNCMNITKLCDFGKYTTASNGGYRCYREPLFDELYKSKNKDPQEKAVYKPYTEPASYLYYVTKDGYVSSSIMDMLYSDSLSYVDTLSTDKYIKLPVKFDAANI